MEQPVRLHINNNTVRTTTLFASLLLVCGLLLPAPAEAADGPALGSGILGGVSVTDAPGDFFTPKAQAVGAVNVLLDIPLFSGVFLGLGFQLHDTLASSLSGGWSYRSHWGGGLRLSAGYGLGISDSSRPLELELGASAGGSANYDVQTWTTLYFFYPGIFLEPYLELHKQKWGRHSFTLILPLDYYFRKELDFSASIGIGVIWKYYFKRR
jgi:hypothetical protein